MIAIGDVHVYVTDLVVALRFWADGVGLEVVDQEIGQSSGFATLASPEGGPLMQLFSGADPWPEGSRPMVGVHPSVQFDVMTDEFDGSLVRLVEHGGAQVGEIEEYNELRVVSIADPDGNIFELIEVPLEEDGEPDA